MIITLRNVVELSESTSSILPSTFVPLLKFPASTTLSTLMTPVIMVILSEICVDWLKHAFITKFNQIRPSIYGKYVDILCRDLIIGSPGRLNGRKEKKQLTFIDQSPVVSRRIGFPSIPLACMTIRMMQQLLPMIFMSSNSNNNDTSMDPFSDTVSSSSSHPTTMAAMITHSLITYLIQLPHHPMIGHFIPIQLQSFLLSILQGGWFEQGLHQLFKIGTWLMLISLLAIM